MTPATAPVTGLKGLTRPKTKETRLKNNRKSETKLTATVLEFQNKIQTHKRLKNKTAVLIGQHKACTILGVNCLRRLTSKW